MSYVQRSLNYLRANPIFTYIAGGVALLFVRQASVDYQYQQNFAVYDIQRKKELERYLATHGHTNDQDKH